MQRLTDLQKVTEYPFPAFPLMRKSGDLKLLPTCATVFYKIAYQALNTSDSNS